jgi:hypothetical protein
MSDEGRIGHDDLKTIAEAGRNEDLLREMFIQ